MKEVNANTVVACHHPGLKEESTGVVPEHTTSVPENAALASDDLWSLLIEWTKKHTSGHPVSVYKYFVSPCLTLSLLSIDVWEIHPTHSNSSYD